MCRDPPRIPDELSIRLTSELKEVMVERYIAVRLEKASNVVILS